MYVLRGGEEVTGSTLPRFFALHVAFFPALLTVFVAAHLFFIQMQGIHEPDDWKAHPEQRKTMPFFPHFFMRELLLWLITLILLGSNRNGTSSRPSSFSNTCRLMSARSKEKSSGS
jgi:quinol-cytochrome oxidoreductase complex cytochrome b subunit